VTLHEERPVVHTETVPTERVRLSTETRRDTEQVGRDVRREEIELDEDGHDRR
jgi:stress response protein YsnF